MKKILYSILTLVLGLVLSSSGCNTMDAPDPSMTGDGSAANPYVISTPAQLDAMRDDLDAYYKLGGNIDLTNYLKSGGAGYAKWGTKGWEPIGDAANSFQGGFDGAGFKITGLTINRPTTDYVGLFGYIYSPVTTPFVKNVGLEGVSIIGNKNVGSVVGTIEKCSIKNCYVTGTVKGSEYVGGVAGYIDQCNINYCFTTGSVNGNSRVGGLAGGSNSGSITNNYATCAVSGTDSQIGGVVGNATGGTVSYCYSTGEVNGCDKVGGVVGESISWCTISNCVALNQAINRILSSLSDNFGRVLGGGYAVSTFINNAAWVFITGLGGITYGEGGRNGANLSIATIQSDGTLGSRFSTPNWVITAGKLPVLSGFQAGTQNNNIPTFIF